MDRLFSPGGDILLASEGTLIYFATYLAKTVKHSTIKLYLAAVRNVHILCGHADPVVGKLLLKRVSSGHFTLSDPYPSTTCYPKGFVSNKTHFTTLAGGKGLHNEGLKN